MIESRVDKEAFGNELIVYGSADLLIRFATGRGDIYIDIASTAAPSEWFLLNSLFEFFGYKSDQFVGDRDLQMKNLSATLAVEFARLKLMLAPIALPETLSKMEEFRRQKMKQMFPTRKDGNQ